MTGHPRRRLPHIGVDMPYSGPTEEDYNKFITYMGPAFSPMANWLRNSLPDPNRKGGRLWLNTGKAQFDRDLALAEKQGAQRVKAGTPGFEALMAEKVKHPIIKWAYTCDRELWVVPNTVKGEEISHAVAADNTACFSVGTGYWKEYSPGDWVLVIDNHTGHYVTSMESVTRFGLPAWRLAVGKVECKEEDGMAALNAAKKKRPA